jgi:hypothetical protein
VHHNWAGSTGMASVALRWAVSCAGSELGPF